MKNPAHRYTLVIDSPLGRLGILIASQQVQRLDYLPGSVRLRAASGAFERKVARELGNYFNNPGACFSVAFELAGTPFQQRVWQALTKIPAGETRTYGDLAAGLDSGARAVGNACRHNPVSIIVPCHRVVAASGIGGYSGSTAPAGPELTRKSWLLQHESQLVPALKNTALAPDRCLPQEIQRNSPA